MAATDPSELVEQLLASVTKEGTPSKRARALRGVQQRLARLGNDELLAVLTATADDLDEAQRRLDAGYDLRLLIFQAGRERDVKVTQRAMGDAARVSEPAVIQALKKARLAATG